MTENDIFYIKIVEFYEGFNKVAAHAKDLAFLSESAKQY